MKSVTGKPIKFAGLGEKLDEFEAFHPERMAGRILGMGDVVSLVEKAAEVIDEDEAKRMEEKMRKGNFTLEDFLEQMRAMKKWVHWRTLWVCSPAVIRHSKARTSTKVKKK